jgi:hypothetical protein
MKKKLKGNSLIILAVVGSVLLATVAFSVAQLSGVMFSSLGINKVSMQAHEYAQNKAEAVRMDKYLDVATETKHNIDGTDYYQEVLVGAETPYNGSDTVTQKAVKINIYHNLDATPIVSLDVTRTSMNPASGVPIGTIIIWGAENNPADGTWLDCDGQSTASYPELAAIYGTNIPDYRGMFLRGYGSTTINYGTYGAIAHTSGAVGEVQGTAIRNITGSTWGLNTSDTNALNSVYTGAFYVKAYGYLNNTGRGVSGMVVGFDPSRVVPTAEENRPVNKAVRYLIKAA